MAADQLLLWLAVGGVATALTMRPALFASLQLIGAIYLAWLGLKLIATRSCDAPAMRLTPGHYARQAFLITLLNPKALVFYMAFVPLFIDPVRHRGLVTFSAISATVAVITALWCLGLCALAGRFAGWFRRRPAAGLWLQRCAGATLIGFGIRLLG